MILIQYNSRETIVKGEVRERPIRKKIRDSISALQLSLGLGKETLKERLVNFPLPNEHDEDK